MKTFKATVDQGLISSASTFFDNGLKSILRELLQNSRRAGATRVNIDCKDGRWLYEDNGPGCEPEVLLGLGQSAWESESVKELESPAGCGFFSLSRRKPTVSCPSRGWSMHLTEAQFNAKELVSVQVFDPLDYIPGLRIEFDVSNLDPVLGLNGLCKHLDMDIFFRGEQMTSRIPFFSRREGDEVVAKKTFELPGLQVQVELCLREGPNDRILSSPVQLCYNGFLLDHYRDIRSNRGQLVAGFRTVDGGTYYDVCKVLVTRESALPLELPQRNSPVLGEEYTQLMRLLEFTALEMVHDYLSEVCVESPLLWADAVKYGYKGPVLRPKWIGRIVKRVDADDIEGAIVPRVDYQNKSPRCLGRYVTAEEVASSRMLMVDEDDDSLIMTLAQTSKPSGTEEFADGIVLVEPLRFHSVTDAAASEMLASHLELIGQRKLEPEHVEVWLTSEDGSKELFSSNKRSQLVRGIELKIHHPSFDAAVFSLPALFDVSMGNFASDVYFYFCVTGEWLDRAAAYVDDFAMAVASTCYHYLLLDEDGDVDAEEQMRRDFEESLYNLTNKSVLFEKRMLRGVQDAFWNNCHLLPSSAARVTVEVGSEHCNITVLPEFVCHYTFFGSHGSIECDAEGNRASHQQTYQEYAAFDVATMRRLGLDYKHQDILYACGWRDSSRLIYMTPSVPPLLRHLGFIDNPCALPDQVQDGMLALFNSGRISDELLYALWLYDSTLLERIPTIEFSDDIKKRILLAL